MKSMDEILSFLKEDIVKNINMINFMENYPVTCIEMYGKSVILKGTSDRDWIYISSESKEELKNIKDKLGEDDRCFAIIEDWMIPILTKGSRIKWKLSTMKFFLPQDVSIAEGKYKVENLKIEDADSMYANSDYKDYISIEYIKDRIQKGLSSCIYDSGNLAAWALTQDDGAMGFLHVLPQYRRRGYARAVTIDLINKVRAKGKLPFVHIEEDNKKSMNLALSLGFKKDRVVNWLEY
jgi:GNAT superfamily N-acetyltransferase